MDDCATTATATSLLRRSPETTTTTTLAAVTVSFLLLIALLNLRRGHRRRLPTNWPVVGNLPALLSNHHRVQDFATELLEAAGCTFLFRGPWFCRMDLLVTADPANVNHIFNANFANYPKGDEFAMIFDVLGNGIFSADYRSWKAQRRMTHSLMAEPTFRRFVLTTSRRKVVDGIVPVLEHAAEERHVIDLQDVFLRFTFDVTSILVMAVDPGCLSPGLPVVPFAQAMDDAEEVLFYRHVVPGLSWKLMRWMGVGREKRMAIAWKTIDGYIGKHVSRRKDRYLEGNRSPDLLSSFLDGESIDPEKRDGLEIDSEAFLRDTAVNLMLAGRDTTAAGLTWFFWLLSKNRAVEAKILSELRENVATVYEDGQEYLNSLVYLHAALCETLRLYPPVPFEHKSVLSPEVLPSGHEARPEVKVLVSLYAMARMKGVWGEDCREFRPERWISEKGRIRHEPSYKFMSFNSGPRTCLGKEVAFTQMKAVAAAVLARFEVDVDEGRPVVPKSSIILHMKDGFKVRIKNRGRQSSDHP